MQVEMRRSVKTMIAFFLVTIVLVPTNLMAQSHVVSPADLQNAAVAASQTRQHNVESVEHLLSTPSAEKAMRSANMDPQQVRTGVATLSDQELAQLASKADKAQADFAAGNLTERDLIWIILGIAVLVLVIVAVR